MNINTVNKLIEVWKDIATRHYQINSFGIGNDWEIGVSTAEMHPTLWIEPVTATMPSGDNGYYTFEIDFEVRVFDLVNKNESNENDVLSDTIDILKDIIIQFKEHPFYVESQIDIINDISFESFTEEFDEEVSGWLCEISLMTPVLTTYCGIASEPIPEPVPPVASYLLDDYPNASVGYSLRLLDSAYVGDAIQVRRDSDNATLDIGFIGEDLDTASLITFCSGTNAFVTTWYDQSGNNRNGTQGTASSQPKIYDSVTGISNLNGKPSINWDSANPSMNFFNAGFPGSLSYTVSSVFSSVDTAVYSKLFALSTTSPTSGFWTATQAGGTSGDIVDGDTVFGGNGYDNPTGATIISDGMVITGSATVQNTLTTVLSSSNAKMIINGSEIAYRVQRTGDCYNASSDLYIGNTTGGGNTFNGRFQELILWQSDRVADIVGMDENNNNFYNTY